MSPSARDCQHPRRSIATLDTSTTHSPNLFVCQLIDYGRKKNGTRERIWEEEKEEKAWGSTFGFRDAMGMNQRAIGEHEETGATSDIVDIDTAAIQTRSSPCTLLPALSRITGTPMALQSRHTRATPSILRPSPHRTTRRSLPVALRIHRLIDYAVQ